MTEEKQETLIDRMMSVKGGEIKAAREKMGITQAELAARAGTNQQTIDRIERGLTRLSKYMPEIRVALGLPAYEEPEESLLRFSGKYNGGYGVRAHIAEDFRDPEKMPIFKLIEENGNWIIDMEPVLFLPRSYPVEGELGAYGIIVPDDRLAPALRVGEIAIVNPDGTTEWGSEVILLHGLEDGRTAALLRSWIGFDHYVAKEERKGADQYIKVRTWNPPTSESLRFLKWPAMGPVVAKLPAPKI